MTPQQQMIVDAFNSQVYIQDRMDVQHTPLYDTVYVPPSALAGTVNVLNNLTGSFFTNVGPGSGKSIGECNLGQPQKLPAPHAFSVFAIRLRWSEDVVRDDIDAILGSSTIPATGVGSLVALHSAFALEFWMGDKCYNRAPLWFYTAGGGLFVNSTLAGAQSVGNGVPGHESMHKLALPLVIENQTTFWANLVGNQHIMTDSLTRAGTGITMQLLLDGLWARGVQ